MGKNTADYKVHVNFKNKDEQERRLLLNKKLAGIINLEANSLHNKF